MKQFRLLRNKNDTKAKKVVIMRSSLNQKKILYKMIKKQYAVTVLQKDRILKNCLNKQERAILNYTTPWEKDSSFTLQVKKACNRHLTKQLRASIDTYMRKTYPDFNIRGF